MDDQERDTTSDTETPAAAQDAATGEGMPEATPSTPTSPSTESAPE